MRNSRQEFSSRLIPFLIFGITALVFFPVIHWLLRQTISHDQLTHAFTVYMLTGVLLATQRDLSFKPVWKFSDTSQNLLVASYLMLAVSIFTRFNLLIFLSLGLSLAALLIFAFGKQRQRFIYSSVGTFTIFASMVTFLPVMDWPLRTLAGKWAAAGLQFLGHQVQLGLSDQGQEPMLILLNNGRPFHVAAACNGFGMLSSCLLMALIIVLYRRMSLAGRLGRLVVAFFMALLFNALRIILIILIAPGIASDHYMFMHETVGLVTTYGGLAILYFLLSRNPGPSPVS